MHDLDVIVCTVERHEHVCRTARDVLGQLGPHDTLLVVDQSRRVQPTRDALAALADPRVRHLPAPARGLPAARNLGLAQTRASIVVYLDDDVIIDAGCLDAHRAAFADPAVGGTVGSIRERTMVWNAARTRNEVDRFGRVRVNLEGSLAVDVRSLKGCNMALRREAMAQVGGFDEGYGGTAFLEEADVSERLRRAGWRLRFVPEASVEHLSAPSGGVRVGGADRTERWRFENTGRFVARHRGIGGTALAVPMMVAIAARRALEWRDPSAVARLLGRYGRGVLTTRR